MCGGMLSILLNLPYSRNKKNPPVDADDDGDGDNEKCQKWRGKNQQRKTTSDLRALLLLARLVLQRLLTLQVQARRKA